MNRRSFSKGLVALFSIPALPALPTLSMPAATAAVTVPAKASSWAVYMSSLHGECTPQALHSLLNIPVSDAKRYVTQLIADGVIKPNPILNETVSNIVEDKKDGLLEKVKERFETNSKEQSSSENFETEAVKRQCDHSDDLQETLEEAGKDDVAILSETQPPDTMHRRQS